MRPEGPDGRMTKAVADEEEARGLVSPTLAQSGTFSFFSARGLQQRAVHQTNFCIVSVMVWVATAGVCVACFFYCPYCLIPLALIFWFVTCCGIPYYCFPMVISILLFCVYFVSHDIPRLEIVIK